MKHLDKILIDLQLNDKSNDLILDRNQIKNIFSKKELETLLPHFDYLSAVFLLKKNPFILFFVNPKNEKELHKWIWNYNKSAVVFIIKNKTVDILNGFELNNNGFLEILENSENLQNFNYLELVTGQTWEKYSEKLKFQNRVDYKLLKNIETVRNAVIQELENNNILKSFEKSKSIINAITNKLIGRLLFIRYLIDRKIKIHFPENNSDFHQSDLIEILGNPKKTYQLFRHLRKEFNGDLFPFTDEIQEFENITEEQFVTNNILQLFINLFTGAEITFYKGKKTETQLSLFQFYDFSVIPVEFISNIYEQFIGVDNQKDKGAYYTPLFLVNYILEKTIKKHFETCETTNCRVLDPACGSSIFLVETLRTIIEKYRELNPDFNSKSEKYKEDLKNLVRKNIFGIDSDPNAIDVSIFSIYITLLDYQEPADIETFKLPPLKNTNFFVSDFFNTENEFNKLEKFDFIIGNPPWGKVAESIPLYKKYFKERSKKESIEKVEIKIADEQIAQAFVLRASDFTKETTEIAFLVTSKILYNLQSVDFRKYLLKNYFLDHIFEISSVRHHVFDKSNDKAVAPACVMIYRYANGKDTNSNTLNHISLKPNLYFKLFKIFVIEKQDIKEVAQNKFIKYDWLFKLLVYGNVLDFGLIERLKRDYKKIYDIICNEKEFIIGEGIIVGGGDEKDITYLINKPFIKSQTDISPFFINPSLNNWEISKAHRPRNPNLFKGNSLLITRGAFTEYKCISAISYNEAVFKHSLTAIHCNFEKNITILKEINGFLFSKLFSYNILQTGSSIGIEREQVHDKEKFEFPYISSILISDLVSQIEQTKKQIHKNSDLPKSERLLLEEKDKNLLTELNEAVFEAFELDDVERALIDYALEISIPLVQQQNSNYPFDNLTLENQKHKDYLEKYAQIYIDFFSHRFSNNFGVEILHSHYAICMRFYHTFDEITEKIIFKKEEINNIHVKLLKTASTNITEELYMQKDVRGFEKTAFYIIKPNQRKLWHRAMAWSDAFEFIDVLNEMKMKDERASKK
jgi:hypothetical protein